MSLAIFGASFDPPTISHQKIVEHFSKQFEEVWILPVYSHVSKTISTPFEKRLEMTRLAFPNHKILTVEREFEFDCTEDVLKFIRKHVVHGSFEYIMGMDSFIDMISGSWIKPLTCEVNVVLRHGRYNLPRICDQSMFGLVLKFVHVPDLPDVSSTLARQSETVEELDNIVCKEVREYIVNEGLYHYRLQKVSDA